MKKILPALFMLLLIFSVSNSKVAAQSYIPLPDSNAYWLLVTPDWWDTEAFATDSVKNDTLINATYYTKLFFNPEPQFNPIFYYIGGYRNDTANKKTFYVPADSIQEFLLYDFSVNAGDTIWQVITRIYTWPPFPIQYTTIDLRVDSVDYITLGPKNHKRLYLWDITNSWLYVQWCEKIGSQEGIIGYAPVQCNCLVCMSHNDTMYYGDIGFPYYTYEPGRCDTVILPLGVHASASTNTYEIYPSPAMDYLSVVFSNTASYPVHISICNSWGKVCKTVVINQPSANSASVDVSELSDGMYFIIAKNQDGVYETQKFIKQ